MRQEIHVLPVQCKRCDGIFDLWYDLQEQEKSDLFELPLERKMTERLIKESFCWKCRQAALDELREANAGNESADDQEFEMLLSYE